MNTTEGFDGLRRDDVARVLVLARDLAAAVAAFVVTSDRALRYVSSSNAPADIDAKVRTLARSCLQHPDVAGSGIVRISGATGAPPSGDGAADAGGEAAGPTPVTEPAAAPLAACIAVPIFVEGAEAWLGLLGLVDPWIPDLDADLEHKLRRLAARLARALVGSGAHGMSSADTGAQRRAGPATTAPPPTSTTSTTPAPQGPGQSFTFLAEVTDGIPDAVAVVSRTGTVVFASNSIEQLLGWPPHELLGRDVADFVDPESRASLPSSAEARTAALAGEAPPGRRVLMRHRDGSAVDTVVTGRAVSSRYAGDSYVTQWQAARGAAPRSDLTGPSALEAAVDCLDDGIVVTDGAGVVLAHNPAAIGLLGLAEGDVLAGRRLQEAGRLRDADRSTLDEDDHPVTRALMGERVRGEHLILPDDPPRHVLVSARPFRGLHQNGLEKAAGALVVLRDVTAQHDYESWLKHLALHDPLTGLANRALLLDHLNRALIQSQRQGGVVGLVYLDLDGFKRVNDEHGHLVGDEILVALGRRIQGAVRPTDTVARIGGDEFVVLAQTNDRDPAGVELVTDRIRAVLHGPYQVRGLSLTVPAAVGAVVADPRTDDATSLMVRADREMYRRKSQRSGGTDPT